MLLLSRAPEGMDDLSDGVLQQLETYSRLLGFNNILVIDCHNALGSQLSQTNYESLLDAGRKCLEELSRSQEFSFRIGFANLCDISYDMDSLKDDLGGSGLATMAIEVNAHYYVIGWADSNNMDNTLREQLVSFMSERGIQLLEVCTSDTHATSGKRTRQGYFAFGSITRPKIAAEIFYLLARKSIESLTPSIFELASIKTKVRVMGKKQFDEYAVALNKSLFLTKIFVLTTVSIFIATLIL
jgi:putative membrane protein